ncbi:hypothetical protein GJA_3885 [Janthinobacterium agaricidamnosum NBRC 102515 = DSM 9628]|uniref:Uncharacterized protein n=1 Tax=Janthinobacterium agaricidamnosum NBRC 102515 = DSM 9628 TaxID=1349767 RepID=W0V9E4_9BURK|nr:hypothetical protein GJA_3885 [Janthinobacterium agaricidamnosum NBRC 102515 = DSM 9628]
MCLHEFLAVWVCSERLTEFLSTHYRAAPKQTEQQAEGEMPPFS